MAGTAALLSRGRWVALGTLTAALAAYTASAGYLWEAELWPDLIFLSLVVFPATFGLIWLALPLHVSRATLPIGLTLAAAAVLLRLAELDVLFNLTKLFALTFLGFWFLTFFENVAWVAAVAVIIPWVDAVSVWKGPTEYVVEEQPQIFDTVSIAFRVPGEDGTANLGPPDILFCALFLAAARRFGLRIGWTWLGITGLVVGTLILTATTDVSGLPALPAVAFGFLLANADLIWTALRRKGRAPARIYGRTDESFYDLEADVIERGPSKVVLLTRERPPLTASVEPVDAQEPFAADPGAATGDAVLCRLLLGRADGGEALVYALPNGVVVVPQGGSSLPHAVHPEQLAADEDKIERLIRERR